MINKLEGRIRTVIEGTPSSIESLERIGPEIGIVVMKKVPYLEALPHLYPDKLLFGNERSGYMSVVKFNNASELEVATLKDFENFNATQEITTRSNVHFNKLRKGLLNYYSHSTHIESIIEEEAAALSQTLAGNPMIPIRLMEEVVLRHKQKYSSVYGLGEVGQRFVSDYLTNALSDKLDDRLDS